MKKTTKAVTDLHCGTVLADKYRITEGRPDIVDVFPAVHIASGNKVFLHFHDNRHSSLNSAAIYHGSTSASMCVCRWVETVRDVTEGPPFLVFERGAYTFAQWLEDPGRPFVEKRCALRKILRALVDLHEQGRAIGDLAPNRIFWFPEDHTWKLLDVYRSGAQSRSVLPNTGVKYAAPETVLPELRHEKRSAPDYASDMWSFGVMVLDVLLSGESLYSPDASVDADRRITLSRKIALRLASLPGEHAYTLLRNLLQIHPIKRCTAAQALQSAFFYTLDRPRTESVQQNEIRHLLSPNVLDTALQISSGRSLREARTSIRVERFLKRSNSSDSFHLREAKEACTVTDTVSSRHCSSIFLLKAGQNFRIRIRHESDGDAPITLPSRYVSTVYTRVDEGEYIPLDTEQISEQGSVYEVVAFVEPTRLQSPRLLVASSTNGTFAEKYVKLDIVMKAAFYADVDHGEARQYVIYCKVLPRTSRMLYHRFRYECIDMWHHRGPQNNAAS